MTIYIKLQGGLGNQMFQYALGRHLEHIHNTELKLDISWFNNIKKGATYREYKLGAFNIIENIATDEEIKKLKKYEYKNGRQHFLHNFFFANNSIYIKEKQTCYDENILKLSNNIYLDGFWQSEKYFKNIKLIIFKDFTLKENLSKENIRIAEKISKTTSVSVHIRRGDYVNSNQHDLYDKKYYKKAEEIINKKVKNPHFFIFSDDINWAKKNVGFEGETTYIENNQKNKDHEDMKLMSLCKHNIIINSSFSWWGAWLNKNPNKIIIAPRDWVKKEIGQKNDRLCEGWTTI